IGGITHEINAGGLRRLAKERQTESLDQGSRVSKEQHLAHAAVECALGDADRKPKIPWLLYRMECPRSPGGMLRRTHSLTTGKFIFYVAENVLLCLRRFRKTATSAQN